MCLNDTRSGVPVPYIINPRGIHSVADQVKAIVNAPQTTNQTQLKSFLVMLNYYHRFLPNVLHHAGAATSCALEKGEPQGEEENI